MVIRRAKLHASLAQVASNVLRALRHRNYRLYFFGQGLSLIGTWMSHVATAWLVYRLTGSAVLLGVVGFAGQIPAFVLSPVAGVLVDRWDRRLVLLWTQALAMLQVLVLAVLCLTGWVTLWQVIVISVFQGVLNAFDIPARQAFIVDLLEDPNDMSNAIALNSSVFNGARLIGPSIAGLIIAVTNEGVCFLIDGLSYLAVMAAFYAMRFPKPPSVRQTRSLLKELREGFDYAWHFAPIRAILLSTALVSLVGMPYSLILPVFAREALGGGSGTFGFLTAASGLGSLAGALYLASRRTVLGLGGIIFRSGILFGLGLVAFGLSRELWLALISMSALGFGMLVQLAAGNTLVQTIVEEDKRGRVTSLYVMAFMGMMPIGSLVAGTLTSRLGAPFTLVLGGLGCLTGIILFGLELPRLRAAIRPIYIRKGILPQVAAGLQKTDAMLAPPEE